MARGRAQLPRYIPLMLPRMRQPGFLRTALDTVFPPVCPVTGAETGASGTLSPEAWADLALLAGPRCLTCGREMPGEPLPGEELTCDPCHRHRHLWHRGAAAFRYEGTGRRLVLSLKHGDRLDLAPMLARWMAQTAPELVASANLIAPVPLHWRRLMKRRFNQSAEIARALCRIAGKHRAYAPGLIRRHRATASQDGRDRAGRIANLADAFSLTARGRSSLAGRELLIIDDVLTTGATLEALAKIALAGGAARVNVLVCALVNYEARTYISPSMESEDLFDETD